MPAQSRPAPFTEEPMPPRVVSCAEFNRARSHRVLDRARDDGRIEARPWAYVFPRPLTVEAIADAG